MFDDYDEEVERLSYGHDSLKKSFNKSGDNLSEG